MRLLVPGGAVRVGRAWPRARSRAAGRLRTLPAASLEVGACSAPDLVLRRVSPGEVARFVLDCLEDPRTIGKVFFIGRR
ncbi:MAG: hypothetical protein NZ555_15550 [Geminicoccaceae bacterium]|nr:hypothetical protein [Geminicoccaceae bacterium]MDW8370227.1 hypothetical protein [Geminicoccaceae bacterium]